MPERVLAGKPIWDAVQAFRNVETPNKTSRLKELWEDSRFQTRVSLVPRAVHDREVARLSTKSSRQPASLSSFTYILHLLVQP